MTYLNRYHFFAVAAAIAATLLVGCSTPSAPQDSASPADAQSQQSGQAAPGEDSGVTAHGR